MTSPDDQAVLRARLEKLPCWQGAITFDELPGGITNQNLLVTDVENRHVVRFGDDIPAHHILRSNELAVSQAAHAAGLSPAVRYFEPGVLVLEYIQSTTLTPASVRDPDMLLRIVDLIKRAHHQVPVHLRGGSVMFWVFHVIRDYAAALTGFDSRWTDELPRLLSIARELEAIAGPFDIVFGHNDLLAANLLDDGQRLWLIDWEYGGFNTPLFDLGGLASNNALDETQERWMLEHYFERPVDEALWRRYRAMCTASLLRETLWSMVSECVSTLDFDYASYTTENLSRFEASYLLCRS